MIGSFRSDVHPFTDRVQYRWAARETPQRCLAPQPASSRLFRLFFTLHLFGTMRARQFACRRATPRFRAAEKKDNKIHNILTNKIHNILALCSFCCAAFGYLRRVEVRGTREADYDPSAVVISLHAIMSAVSGTWTSCGDPAA